jgi:MinD superfamily P-loop ATPase
VVLVTEPTPFGLHDLRLAVEVTAELGVPAGVVVNRSGRGEAPVRRFCAEAGLPILAELPDDRRVAEAYARGQLPADVLPDVRARFTALWEAIDRARRGAAAGARTGDAGKGA